MHGKTESTDTNIEITQLLEFSDKDFKAAVIKLLQYVEMATLEKKWQDRNDSKQIELKNKWKF